MWTLHELQDNNIQTLINGKWVPARPLNFTKQFCPIWKRIVYAYYVIIGKHETFEWPEKQ